MKLIPILTTAILASSILTAQAAPKSEQELTLTATSSSQSEIDSKKEVAYTCQILQDNKLQSIKLTAVNIHTGERFTQPSFQRKQFE